MIIEYHRPTTVGEAMALLQRTEPRTLPLAGGTALVRPSPEPLAVVDLQALGLDKIQAQGSNLSVGATVTLHDLLNWIETSGRESAPGVVNGLERAIRHEATNNLRRAATVAGTLVAASGRSPLATVLLALDARLTLLPDSEPVGLGDLLPMRTERLARRLITSVELPVNARLSYHFSARTPADLALVSAAVARWPSGRVRLALGGYGSAPLVAFDGDEPGGFEVAARSAYHASGDAWASAEYRSETAGVLALRCLAEV